MLSFCTSFARGADMSAAPSCKLHSNQHCQRQCQYSFDLISNAKTNCLSGCKWALRPTPYRGLLDQLLESLLHLRGEPQTHRSPPHILSAPAAATQTTVLLDIALQTAHSRG